jgi:hypothetical protein
MLEGEIVTLQVRPLLDNFEIETSIILPTGRFDELLSAFLASLKDKKPETSVIPRFKYVTMIFDTFDRGGHGLPLHK